MLANPTADGKQVAGNCQTPLNDPHTSPLLSKTMGTPSVTIIDGIPNRSIPFKYQKSNPEHNLAFSYKVICVINFFISLVIISLQISSYSNFLIFHYKAASIFFSLLFISSTIFALNSFVIG